MVRHHQPHELRSATLPLTRPCSAEPRRPALALSITGSIMRDNPCDRIGPLLHGSMARSLILLELTRTSTTHPDTHARSMGYCVTLLLAHQNSPLPVRKAWLRSLARTFHPK